MNRSKRIIIPLACILLLLWGNLRLDALEPGKRLTQYQVKVWNMESELPGNSVYAILQTADGFLWVGMQGGLVRFDGMRFKVFNRRNTPELKDNVVRALLEDSRGNLWIGTSSGGLTRYSGGRFFTYGVDEYNHLKRISSLCEDDRGNLWIGSSTEGLSCLRDGRFSLYSGGKGLPDNNINRIYKDENGVLWITTASWIVKMEIPGKFHAIVSQNRLRGYKTTALYEKDSATLWIGTGDRGLNRLKDDSLRSYSKKSGLPHATVTYLYRDSHKQLWIGTDGGGLTRMSNGELETLSGYEELNGKHIYSIYEDRDGSLWVGTLDSGLYQFSDNKFATYTSREGLTQDYIHCIHESAPGTIWVGTRTGVNCLERGTVVSLPAEFKKLERFPVLAITENKAGELYFGTWGGGVYRLKNNRLTSFSLKKQLPDARVSSILFDRDGHTWIGTARGLCRIAADDGSVDLLTVKNGLLSNFIESLYEDGNGKLIVCTDAGINALSGTTVEPDPITGATFRCTYRDKRGVLWFGSDNGLLRFEKGVSRFFNSNCCLMENFVFTILEDDNGYLWLGGRNGITRVARNDLEAGFHRNEWQSKIKVFNEKDGMKARWCTGSGFRSRDGRFWFPTSGGLSVIDPLNIKTSEIAPSLIMEGLVADGEGVPLEAATAGGTERAGYAQVTLAPGKKRLEFFYTAAGFINPREIRFKVRLDGYDSHWVDVGTARSATYTGLLPGEYTFNAIAANADGVWGSETASLSLYLKPLFYQTAWFFYAVVLFGLFGAFFLYRLRIRQLKNRQKELAGLVDLRTRDLQQRNLELENAQQEIRQTNEIIAAKNEQLEIQSAKLKKLDEAKSRFFTNISHEFRTPLTLIMGPLDLALSNYLSKEELLHHVPMMLKNSRLLLELVNQLLELARFDSGNMKIVMSRLNIVPFLKNTMMYFDSVALQDNVRLKIEHLQDRIYLYFDREKMEKVITNLISNAFNYTPKGGKITISVAQHAPTAEFPEGFVEISVRDTGTGIPEEQLPHIFKRFYRGENKNEYRRKGTGIGLALTRELVTLHCGDIRAESSCKPGKDRGTVFIIRLPLGDGHLKPDEVEIVDAPEEEAGTPELLKVPSIVHTHISETLAGEQEEKPLVLVVEDHADVSAYVRRILEDQFRVEEALNGKEGVEKARELLPDLIISDVMMPEMDGIQLCRALKNDALTGHIPIILLTAREGETEEAVGLESGADDYITKPFSTEILEARVSNLIQLRRQLQSQRKNMLENQPAQLPVSPIDEKFLASFEELVERFLSEQELSVNTISDELDMSQATLNRKIRALTGQTPVQFIRSYRLSHAARLLKNGAESVGAVALKVGFANTNYFSKCFKEQFHYSPSTLLGGASAENGSTVPETQKEKGGNGRAGNANGKHHRQPSLKEVQEVLPEDVILIVEDNDDARHYIKQSLDPEFRVVEAADGVEGVNKAFDTIPDLVVSDIMMPEKDGYQLCRELKGDVRTSHIPIILLTAKVSEEARIQGLEAGADDYIVKPFNTRSLLARIRNLIQLRRYIQLKRQREMALLPATLDETEGQRDFVTELERVMDELSANPDFNVETLAEKLLISRTSLFRKIRALYDETPSEYIRSYRLNRAVKLLEENFGSVTDIAFEVGFGSQAYFTRCFKEKFQCLPSEFTASQLPPKKTPRKQKTDI